jgi:hypothetical protein
MTVHSDLSRHDRFEFDGTNFQNKTELPSTKIEYRSLELNWC